MGLLWTRPQLGPTTEAVLDLDGDSSALGEVNTLWTCPSHLGANRLISLGLSLLRCKTKCVWDQTMWVKAPNGRNFIFSPCGISKSCGIYFTPWTCGTLQDTFSATSPSLSAMWAVQFLPPKQQWELYSGHWAQVCGCFFFFLSFFFGLINYCKHEVLGHCKVPGKCCQTILWKHYTSLFIHHCEPKCLLLCILAHTGYDHVKFANLKGKHALYLDFHFDSY